MIHVDWLFLSAPAFSYSFNPAAVLRLLSAGSAGDGQRGAVAGGVEDCRSGAKWPLNGSQTRTGFIDALA